MKKLLLLHGALGCEEQLFPLKELLKENYEVYTLDFSGHSKKGMSSGTFSMSLFMNDILSFMEENKIEKTNIFGYSMGGYAALKLALSYPNKIDKIFTLGTKLDWSLENANKEVKMLDADKIVEKVPAFAKELEERHSGIGWQEVLKNTIDLMIDLGGGDSLTENDFKNIVHSVVLGLGEKDHMVNEKETRDIASWLPNANVKIFEGFKHPIEAIDYEILAESLKRFF